jgi:hypothetical protein
MLLLTPGMEIRGSKLGFFIISLHNLNKLLIDFISNKELTHQYFHSIFFKFIFFENLNLTKNNYLQTKLELLLYSILSLLEDE